MDTTSSIHWSWSSTCFRTVGKHLLATVVTASYGFQFGSSTTPWKDHQVYFETDPASCGYLIRVGHITDFIQRCILSMVSLFLYAFIDDSENRLLPNNVMMIRNYGGDKEGLKERRGGAKEQ
jgi:hypothetical protein